MVTSGLIAPLIFGVIVVIFFAIVAGDTSSVSLTISNPPSFGSSPTCNIVTLCLNIVGAWVSSFFIQAAYYLGLVIQIVGLIGSTVTTLGSGGILPFPFNLIFFVVMGVFGVITIVQLVKVLA